MFSTPAARSKRSHVASFCSFVHLDERHLWGDLVAIAVGAVPVLSDIGADGFNVVFFGGLISGCVAHDRRGVGKFDGWGGDTWGRSGEAGGVVAPSGLARGLEQMRQGVSGAVRDVRRGMARLSGVDAAPLIGASLGVASLNGAAVASSLLCVRRRNIK